MYNTSVNPTRLFPTIVEHISLDNPKESCKLYFELARCDQPKSEIICQYTQNIRIHSYPFSEGKGPLDARHLVQSFLHNEEFSFMIDAHTLFVDRWDEILMENWNELGDELGIITTYPNRYPFPFLFDFVTFLILFF
jgi:hypothetical protein